MYATLSRRRLLLAGAALTYTAVFLAFLFFERPGLGIGHFFYIAIALLALATNARAGAAAGVAATGFYASGILLNPNIPPTQVPTASTAIRFTTFVAMGIVLGWFASNSRRLVDELRVLAERDFLTSLPNTRAFEAAISRRLEAGDQFALFLGDMDSINDINDEHGYAAGNEALRKVADALRRFLRPGDDVARVGGDEFAVLAAAANPDDAAALRKRLEFALGSHGCAITFGWAVYPHDGDNALALYRAADERLYARKHMRGLTRQPSARELPA